MGQEIQSLPGRRRISQIAGRGPDVNNQIWLYWENIGRPKPAYYELCQQSVLKHNPSARIIGREEAEELIGPIPKELDEVYIIHRVDWIRKMLLWKHGGMYLDSDFICFESLAPLAGLARTFDFVGYKEWHSGIMDNIMVAKAGSPILKAAADIALDYVKRKGKNVKWLDTNNVAMEQAMESWRWKSKWMMLPTHVLSPVNVCDKDWFIQEQDGYALEHDKSCLGYITSYHTIKDWAQNRTKRELMSGNERVCHIFRHAFGEKV